MDNVIDLNFYPLEKVKNTNSSSRAIGLGVMGEAQMLAESKIRWGSDEHLLKIDEIMEAISYYAIDSSSNLAKEKGKYPTFEGSNWSRGVFPIDRAKREALDLVDRELSCDWEALREKVKRDGLEMVSYGQLAANLHAMLQLLNGNNTDNWSLYISESGLRRTYLGLIPVLVAKPAAAWMTWG